MALTLPHPHLPHTSAHLMADVALGVALAAVISVGVFVITDNETGPVTNNQTSFAPRAYHGSISTLTDSTTGDVTLQSANTPAIVGSPFPWQGRLSELASGSEIVTNAYPWPDRLASD